VAWRSLVALAVYTYLRDGELRVLTCGDVDIEHKVIRVTKAWNRRTRETGSPKGGRSREVPIEPNLLGLLEAMKAGRPDDALLIASFPSERDMARGLRRWLKRAGVKRNELQNRTPTTRPLRYHDLRATGITWRAVRDDPKFELQIEAGHRRFSTTEEYLHLGKSRRKGFGEVVPSLPSELVERQGEVFPDHSGDHTTLSDGIYRGISGADGTRTRGLRRDRPAL
jgi:integrase